MNDISIRFADCIRWATIGQSLLSALLALVLSIMALRYFAKAGAWRRFNFVATFCPSYLGMFGYIAFDLHSRMGNGIIWRTWAGLIIFTVADYAMLVLIGHLLIKRDMIYEEIKHYTILHDPIIELSRIKKEQNLD